MAISLMTYALHVFTGSFPGGQTEWYEELKGPWNEVDFPGMKPDAMDTLCSYFGANVDDLKAQTTGTAIQLYTGGWRGGTTVIGCGAVPPRDFREDASGRRDLPARAGPRHRSGRQQLQRRFQQEVSCGQVQIWQENPRIKKRAGGTWTERVSIIWGSPFERCWAREERGKVVRVENCEPVPTPCARK